MHRIDRLSDVSGHKLGPLAEAPVLVSVEHDIAQDIRTYRAVIASNLDQTSVLELAHSAAPGRKMDSFEIVADWVIATPKDAQAELRQKHIEGLGTIWTSITQHLPALYEILRMPPRPAEQTIVTHLCSDADARKEIVGNLANLTSVMRSAIIKACADNVIIAQEMTQWHSKRRKNRRYATAKAARDLSERRDRQLLESLKQRQPLLVADHIPSFIVDEQFFDEPITGLKARKKWKDPIHQAKLTKRLVNRTSEYSMEEIQPTDTRVTFSHLRDRPMYVAFPALQWTHTNGQREWIDTHDQYVMKQEVFEQSPLIPEDHNIWANPLAGLLTIASQSPDIVSKWPKKMPLKANGFEQEMGSAQTPGLVYMFRKQLMQSGFIGRLEAIIDSK